MRRTVIGLSKRGDKVQATLERAQVTYDYDTVDVDLAAVVGDDLVSRGQNLAVLLRSGDPVRSGLDSVTNHPPGGDPTPLYFQIRSTAADAIAWEQIFVPSLGFCALDQRSPVGRIADTVNPVRGRLFRPPLRIVGVLSAAGRDPRPQLAALRVAMETFAMPATLHVITGDEDLLGALTGPGESGELIGGTPPDVCRQIADARPHLLHLLCHGRNMSGVRTLTFASVGDVDAQRQDVGSVNVSTPELVDALLPSDPWLVVLAACETAEASAPGQRPLAHDLVSNGLTAAIGMRRLVDLKDTDRFCRELYPGITAAICAAVDPPGRAEQVIDWAAVLTGPRRVLSSPDPALVDSWLDPVLYVQSEDLRVISEGDAPAAEVARLQGKLDTFKDFRNRQDPATADPAALAVVEAKITQVETALAAGAGAGG